MEHAPDEDNPMRFALIIIAALLPHAASAITPPRSPAQVEKKASTIIVGQLTTLERLEVKRDDCGRRELWEARIKVSRSRKGLTPKGEVLTVRYQERINEHRCRGDFPRYGLEVGGRYQMYLRCEAGICHLADLRGLKALPKGTK